MTFTKDKIRDVTIHVTEHLLDEAPELQSEAIREVNGGATPDRFGLQTSFEDALAQLIKPGS